MQDNVLTVRIKRLNADARIPQYQFVGDSEADLYAIADVSLQPFERLAVPTGLSAEVPIGFEIQVRPKSGLALKQGITVLNTPGTVDAGYRGEIKVILINFGTESVLIRKGEKIAQMVVVPVLRAHFEEVETLSESDRNVGGFGSTNTK